MSTWENKLVPKSFLHTHECKENEIAYFKIDLNMIEDAPYSFLGLVWFFLPTEFSLFEFLNFSK